MTKKRQRVISGLSPWGHLERQAENYLQRGLFKAHLLRDSLVVQWLGLGVFTAQNWVRFLVRKLLTKKLITTSKQRIILFGRNVKDSELGRQHLSSLRKLL